MEPVDGCHLNAVLLTTDIDLGKLDMAADVLMWGPALFDGCKMQTYHLAVFDEGELLAEISEEITDDVWNISLLLPIQQMALWSPDNPKLYNYTLEVREAFPKKSGIL